MNCPLCKKGFRIRKELVAHVRHAHTDYESVLEQYRFQNEKMHNDLKEFYNKEARALLRG